MSGKRPSRPTHPALANPLWALIQRCWDQDPHLRPEVSEVLRVLFDLESVFHPFRWPSTCELDSFLMYSNSTAWMKLLNPGLSPYERICLILTTLSDFDEFEITGYLFGDDVQTFVDVIDEVSVYNVPPPAPGWFEPC